VGPKCHAEAVTAAEEAEKAGTAAGEPLRLVLCAVEDPLAEAWEAAADGRGEVHTHRGSTLDVPAEAVVSPANSYGWMRGGIDTIYAQAFPSIEQHVRSAVLAYHGGELPVGQAVIVPTDATAPAWLISAPTMRSPGELLPPDTVHPYLAARAVFKLWRYGRLEDERPVRAVVSTIAMPGLGTGIGGVSAEVCARQVMAAWDEVFTDAR
jgi:O-acetyl-ADP-ribose deacetylase (regulator of RNase III)